VVDEDLEHVRVAARRLEREWREVAERGRGRESGREGGRESKRRGERERGKEIDRDRERQEQEEKRWRGTEREGELGESGVGERW
jgi:hypothetical protein